MNSLATFILAAVTLLLAAASFMHGSSIKNLSAVDDNVVLALDTQNQRLKTCEEALVTYGATLKEHSDQLKRLRLRY